MKAYKYKLKPSRKIIAIFESWLVVLCELYNAALQERRDAYQTGGISISKSDQEKQLPQIKKENPRLARIHSQVIQEALRRVDLAFQHFFRRVREGQVPGFLAFVLVLDTTRSLTNRVDFSSIKKRRSCVCRRSAASKSFCRDRSKGSSKPVRSNAKPMAGM